MSEAKFHLVARASILASGDSDDFHHVAPDEVVLVSVESFDRVTRERDEERLLADTRGERLSELEMERDDARYSRNEEEQIANDARADAQDQHQRALKAEADAARLREALDKRGRHSGYCDADFGRDCSCGLDAAIASDAGAKMLARVKRLEEALHEIEALACRSYSNHPEDPPESVPLDNEHVVNIAREALKGGE